MGNCSDYFVEELPQLKLKITRRQFNKILHNINNNKKFEIQYALASADLTEKQFIKLLRKTNNKESFYCVINRQRENFSNKEKLLREIFSNFNRIEKEIFETNPNMIVQDLEGFLGLINGIYGFKLTEEQTESILSIASEILPSNVSKTFKTMFFTRFGNINYSDKFIEKYKSYFSPFFLATVYPQHIDDTVMSKDIIKTIKLNILKFVNFSFGKYAEHFVKVNVELDMDGLLLRKSVDDRGEEILDVTDMFNFYLMKQGENEDE